MISEVVDADDGIGNGIKSKFRVRAEEVGLNDAGSCDVFVGDGNGAMVGEG